MNKHYTIYTRYNMRKCALNAYLYQFNGLDPGTVLEYFQLVESEVSTGSELS